MAKLEQETDTSTQNWNESVLKVVDLVVETASTKVVKPAHKIAKFFVYTIVALVLLTIVLIAFSISFFRALNIVMPVWASYMVLGSVLLVIGGVLWAKK